MGNICDFCNFLCKSSKDPTVMSVVKDRLREEDMKGEEEPEFEPGPPQAKSELAEAEHKNARLKQLANS